MHSFSRYFSGSPSLLRRRPGRALDNERMASRILQGQLVEVRSAAEIRATLDADLTREGLPFMPEMLKFRGRRMTVDRRANRACVGKSTRLHAATQGLSKFNIFKYLQDMADGELSPGKCLRIVGRVLTNRLRAVVGLAPIGAARGPVGPHMTAYVGQRFEVGRRVQKIICEETGKTVHLTHALALKNVRCAGVCAKNCLRAQAHFWREAWLKHADPVARPEAAAAGGEP